MWHSGIVTVYTWLSGKAEDKLQQKQHVIISRTTVTAVGETGEALSLTGIK